MPGPGPPQSVASPFRSRSRPAARAELPPNAPPVTGTAFHEALPCLSPGASQRFGSRSPAGRSPGRSDARFPLTLARVASASQAGPKSPQEGARTDRPRHRLVSVNSYACAPRIRTSLPSAPGPPRRGPPGFAPSREAGRLADHCPRRRAGRCAQQPPAPPLRALLLLIGLLGSLTPRLEGAGQPSPQA